MCQQDGVWMLLLLPFQSSTVFSASGQLPLLFGSCRKKGYHVHFDVNWKIQLGGHGEGEGLHVPGDSLSLIHPLTIEGIAAVHL